MNKKLFFSAILVMALVFGMTVVGCGGDDSGNTDPKTLVISMPVTIFNYGAAGFMVGVFPVGTTNAQAETFTGIIAGADEDTPGVTYSGTDPVNLTLPLYTMSGSRWTGNGKYDIFAILDGGGGHYYKAGSVNISSATTNIQISNANEIFP